jgi:IPT/TIG domain-containing protein
MRRLLLLFAFAGSAFGAPIISSISPDRAPLAGGVWITIRGTGFATCNTCNPPVPLQVFFGDTPAGSIQYFDATRIQAFLPRHLPGPVDVTVSQFDGSSTLPDALTYTGRIEEEFETILLPIYTPPARGAFGSEFHTIARAVNKTNPPGATVQLYGVDLSCVQSMPADSGVFTITGGPAVAVQLPICSTSPGRFLYVPKSQAAFLTMNLRVLDVTRQTASQGTEIPVIRAARMSTDTIVLAGVPISNRFRTMLRIYAFNPHPLFGPAIVYVTTVGAPQTVTLQPGRTLFEPAYAELTNFPIPTDRPDAGTINVIIEQPTGDFAGGPPMWAFITVTNNETQQITTITPE